MSTHIEKASDIPSAPYYVVMNDTYFSGWGPAKDKTAVYVAPCSDLGTAHAVQAEAEARGDQRYVRLTVHRPRLRPHWALFLMDADDVVLWAKKGRDKVHHD